MTHLTRRQFLALGAAGAGIAALPGVAKAKGDVPFNARVSRPIRKYDESVITACTACASHCALTAYRQDKRVAAVIPTAGGCPRGMASMEALYDGERLLTPLKRVGKRGSGKWARIGWEEAAELVASALRGAGSGAVLDMGRPDPLAPFAPALGFGTVVTEESTLTWGSRKARKALYGEESAAIDISGVNTVILWNANEADGGPDFARNTAELIHARSAGAKIVLVSPRVGATGTFADKWIPLKPGYEAQAALALAAKLIEAKAPGAAALKAKLDLDEAELSTLLGRGLAGESGISESDFKWLGARFFEGTVAVRADGSGTLNAKALEGATAVLNSLGGGLKVRPTLATGEEVEATAPREKVTGALIDGGRKSALYLAYRSNPVYASPRSSMAAKAFSDETKVGLVVSFDVNLTETGLCADLLLPAASDLECRNLLSGITPQGVPGYLLKRPVQVWEGEAGYLRSKGATLARLFDGPQPGTAGEALQLGDFLALVAKKAGRTLPFDSVDKAVAERSAKFAFQAQKPWVSVNLAPVTPKIDPEVLSAYVRSHKAPTKGEGLKLVTIDWVELDAAYPNSVFGREIRAKSPVYLNVLTAKKLGFKKGDHVTVNLGGEKFLGQLFTVQTLHPNAVAIARDFGHWASGSAASLKSPDEAMPAVHMERKEFLGGVNLASIKFKPDTFWWREHGPGASLAAASPYVGDQDGAQLWRELSATVGKG